MILPFIFAEAYLNLTHKLETRKFSELKNFNANPRIYNSDYGWELKKNFEYYYITEENVVVHRKTNNLGLASNIDNKLKSNAFKILIIGDSFTEGLGVNTKDSWPSKIQKLLNEKLNKQVEVYNGAVAGYSLDQYYFRLKDLYNKIEPDVIIIGFASATDFYDLSKFGKLFVYGRNVGRNYFELKNDKLIINTSLRFKENFDYKKNNDDYKNAELLILIKDFLGQYSFLYNKLKKSKFIINLVSKSRDLNVSLWPSIEAAISIENNSNEIIKLKIVKKILNKISKEFSSNSKIYLVHIPSVIEVDKKLWDKSFASNPKKYSQNVAEKKLDFALSDNNINFIKVLEKFKLENNINQNKLYLEKDGHLSAYGNEFLSNIIYNEIKNSITE